MLFCLDPHYVLHRHLAEVTRKGVQVILLIIQTLAGRGLHEAIQPNLGLHGAYSPDRTAVAWIIAAD